MASSSVASALLGLLPGGATVPGHLELSAFGLTRVPGAAVNPAEIFGSLVHLALLQLSSAALPTRHRAFRLLLQLQHTFSLDLGLCDSLPPLALPGLFAAGPAVRWNAIW